MKIEDFDFRLPKNLIAQKPKKTRDESKLLVINRQNYTAKDHTFYELPQFLRSGDILVLNDSKVLPARLFGFKKSGGKVEVLIIKKVDNSIYEVIGKKLKIGEIISFEKSQLQAKVIFHLGKISHLDFNLSEGKFIDEILKIGRTPLPPYIKNNLSEKENRKLYQTVYAKNLGSVAAPTAGLHFTKKLLSEIASLGVEILSVTLHVGLGTFAPIEGELENHKMHAEFFQVDYDVYQKIIESKKSGRRIIAVGTTTVRILETIASSQKISDGKPIFKSKVNNKTIEKFDNKISGWTDIFIYPPYKFKLVDALVTNFHLPKSTLLLLVSAFAGKRIIDRAYREAIEKRYRFFSYGDAMFIT